MRKPLKTNALKLCEIFYSFQGESTLVGRPTVFIRLAGCNLRCKICDTKYSLGKGKMVSVPEIMDLIKHFKTPYVCITGGEPLIQKQALNKLINALIKDKRTVSLETNGSILINGVSNKVKRVVDVKTPSTKEQKSFCLKNIRSITPNDEIKFVISDHADFKFAINFIKRHNLEKIANTILFSPNMSSKELPAKLVGWIMQSKLNIIFQPQLHKLIKEKPEYILKHI